MSWANSLVIDKANGEQVIRRPLATDAIGVALRDTFGTFTAPPDDMLKLLHRLDAPPARG